MKHQIYSIVVKYLALNLSLPAEIKYLPGTESCRINTSAGNPKIHTLNRMLSFISISQDPATGHCLKKLDHRFLFRCYPLYFI